MTEPPSPSGDPGAAGSNPAQDPRAPQPGFIPPQPQPPDSGPGGTPPGATPPGATPPGATPPGATPPAGTSPGGGPQGGYPPGGYPQAAPYGQGGYGQGGYGQGNPPGYSGPAAPPPPGYPTADDKTWALIAHFGGAVGVFIGGLFGWVAPLVALMSKGNQSPTVRAHAVTALNFQLTWTLVAAFGYVTFCFRIGEFIIAIAWLVGVITGIIGGIRANEGRLFNYPVSIPLVK